jgi:hypothetical protein
MNFNGEEFSSSFDRILLLQYDILLFIKWMILFSSPFDIAVHEYCCLRRPYKYVSPLSG